MSTVTEGNLKRLEDLIINRFSELESRFNKVDTRLEKLSEETTAIRVDLATVKGELSGMNKRIDKY
jgi:murein lipoprotein